MDKQHPAWLRYVLLCILLLCLLVGGLTITVIQ